MSQLSWARSGVIGLLMLAERSFNITVNYASSADEAKDTVAVRQRHGGAVGAGRYRIRCGLQTGIDETMAKWGRLDVLINPTPGRRRTSTILNWRN